MARTVRMWRFFSEPWRSPIARFRDSGQSGQADHRLYKVLDPAGLKGARLGVVRKYFGFNDAVDQLMETLLGEIKRAGAEIIDPVRHIPTIVSSMRAS